MWKRMIRLNLKCSSIRKKMLFPIVVAMILQMGLFFAIIMWGGMVERLNQNAFDMMNERVTSRKDYLQNEMLHRWSGFSDSAQLIRMAIERQLLSTGLESRDIPLNSELTTQILNDSMQELIYILRRNSVSGAFLILSGQDGTQADQPGTMAARPGILVRKTGIDFIAGSNVDLNAIIGPISALKNCNVARAGNWQPVFQFSSEQSASGQADYYYKPLFAGRQFLEKSPSDLGYWSYKAGSEHAVTYSIPVRNRQGEVLAVLGVEVSQDAISQMMPYGEINAGGKGGYILAVNDSGSLWFNRVISSGPVLDRLFGSDVTVACQPEEVYHHSYLIERGSRSNKDVYASVQGMNLYKDDSPFVQERWALLGIMEGGTLLEFSKRMQDIFLFGVISSLILGTAGAWITGTLLSRPIAALVRDVREIKTDRPVKLKRVQVTEIDELSVAIEGLSRRVADSASKLTQIIRLVDIPVAAFEYQREKENVFCTKGFFQMFGKQDPALDEERLPAEQFFQEMHALNDSFDKLNAPDITVFRLKRETGEQFWVKLKVVEESDRVLGVATDITQEVLERRKVERERDYDPMTNLLNRRAFDGKIRRRLQACGQTKMAALMLLDLDNLKYINDTYGHDVGDEYIRCFADAMKRFVPQNCLLSRMSGDEFHVFFFDSNNKKEIYEQIDAFWKGVCSTIFALPDQKRLRVRASAGVAWYPCDANSVELLMKYADFTMYMVKNSQKGEFAEFDKENYMHNSYLLRYKEELNRLIDDELVEYYFQPIVDARTAEIFAYEALMRPTLETIKSPLEILTLARSQFKLYQIERLTWKNALSAFCKLEGVSKSSYLFVNSIANQVLSEMDIAEIERRYAGLLERVVIELTEEEKQGENCTRIKQKVAARWGAQVALDDFGTGYNSDVALLSVRPDFVKIDISIVRNIDTDVNRQKIMQNLVSYSHSRGIRVIAEGVETGAELRTVIENNVDYIQGYYTARPAPTHQKIPGKVQEEIHQIANSIKNTSTIMSAD